MSLNLHDSNPSQDDCYIAMSSWHRYFPLQAPTGQAFGLWHLGGEIALATIGTVDWWYMTYMQRYMTLQEDVWIASFTTKYI